MARTLKDSCCRCLCSCGESADDEPSVAYLYAFDFDHTIVDQNSDSAVMEIIHDPIPENLTRLYDGTNWAEYMEKIFKFVADEGGTCDIIGSKIAMLRPTDYMIPLLQRICASRNFRTQSRFIVVSDANTFFIETFLSSRVPPLIPDAIITNFAEKTPEGFLKLAPYENQTTCPLCPHNLCKGKALQKYVQLKGPFTRVFYTGDGGNDVCVSITLSPNDILFVRRGFILEKIIERGVYKGVTLDIKAKIVYWDDAKTIEDEMDF